MPCPSRCIPCSTIMLCVRKIFVMNSKKRGANIKRKREEKRKKRKEKGGKERKEEGIQCSLPTCQPCAVVRRGAGILCCRCLERRLGMPTLWMRRLRARFSSNSLKTAIRYLSCRILEFLDMPRRAGPNYGPP